MSEDAPQEKDILKILLATDNHLGYGEKIPERSEDSFRAFEEILRLAVEHSVDFILLGGDLFHEARPSPYTISKCLDLLRKYCLGDKPVEFEFLSDQSLHFSHLPEPRVNYEDPNLNISIPVFTIHGNHDDPIGQKQISALDIVARTGLVNYFGRWNDLSKVDITPILLQKGETKLALYGLSHIKDQRLGRLFRDKKVTFLKPEGEWFSMFVLHQNRCDGRGRKNFVPTTVLPDFLDLVFWGHEHDCLIEPWKCENDIFVTQPGSSVATSLSAGESIEKMVGILQIYKDKFKIDPIPLRSVRPFIFDELFLEDNDEEKRTTLSSKRINEQTMQQVREKVENMIEKANQMQQDSEEKLLPLIRLIVRYTDERRAFNAIRFGQTFKGRIANPEDAVILKVTHLKERGEKVTIDKEAYDRMGNVEYWADRVEDVVHKYFEENKKGTLVVSSVKGLTEAVRRFVDKNDTEAVEVVFDHQCKKTLDKLNELKPELGKVPECLEDLRIIRQQNIDNDAKEVINILDDQQRLAKLPQTRDSEDESFAISDDEDDEVRIVSTSTVRPARGRGSRGGRVRQPRQTRGGARAAKR